MRRDQRTDERRGPSSVNPLDMIEGILVSDLSAASDPLTGPATSTIRVIRWDTGTTFYETEELTETVTNRSTSFTASAGDLLTVQWLNGEWRPQTGSGGGSGPAMVEFQLEEVCCDTLTATASVTRILCSGGSGVELGDLIELIDSRQCHLIGANPEPSMWLGIKGVAIKMEFNISDYPAYSYVCDDLAPITGNNDCKWSILDLCNNGNFCS